jgi:hypothetical protein
VPGDAVKVSWSALVGSEPAALAPTADAAAVWVGLAGAQTVQSIDTTSRQATVAFSLPVNDRYGAEFPRNLLAVPGAARSVAVSAYHKESTRVPLIRIFDDGVDRDAWKHRSSVEESLSGLNLSDMELQGGTMFARGSSVFRTFDVSAQGLERRGTYSIGAGGVRGRMRAVGNRLFSGVTVVDIPTVYPLGRVTYEIQTKRRRHSRHPVFHPLLRRPDLRPDRAALLLLRAHRVQYRLCPTHSPVGGDRRGRGHVGKHASIPADGAEGHRMSVSNAARPTFGAFCTARSS